MPRSINPDTQGRSADRLAVYLTRLDFDQLSPAVKTKAGLCLTDAIGCLIGGYQSPAGDILKAFAVSGEETGQVRILGSALDVSCTVAGFVHAQLINALDHDDIYEKGHLGAPVIATALSLGQQTCSSGRDLITAIVAGYEISGRLGRSMSHSAPRKHVHGHGTWQTLGAAAVAARLLRLSERETAHALSIAAANAPVASCMKTVFGEAPSISKNNYGVATQVGINAARLAASGFEGPLDIFDGPTGFWRMVGADTFDPKILTSNLCASPEILSVGFKQYSCCRIIQSSVEVAVAAMEKAGVHAEDPRVEKIDIACPKILAERPFDNRQPDSPWTAQFSAPYSVALGLLGVPPGPEWFSPAWLLSPRVARLMEKLSFTGVTVPGRPYAARADVRLGGWKTVSCQIDVNRGDVGNPVDAAFIQDKCRRLLIGRYEPFRAEKIIQAINELAGRPNLEDLVRLFDEPSGGRARRDPSLPSDACVADPDTAMRAGSH
jgi:2-methylcitrate dehydratase PrpD